MSLGSVEKTYVAGQEVTGDVFVELEAPIQALGMVVRLRWNKVTHVQ